LLLRAACTQPARARENWFSGSPSMARCYWSAARRVNGQFLSVFGRLWVGLPRRWAEIGPARGHRERCRRRPEGPFTRPGWRLEPPQPRGNSRNESFDLVEGRGNILVTNQRFHVTQVR
jgi:hypothetical protein